MTNTWRVSRSIVWHVRVRFYCFVEWLRQKNIFDENENF
jgi:hypothetical protein